MKTVVCFLLLTILSLRADEGIQVTSEHLCLRFAKETGALVEFVGTASKHQFIEPASRDQLWELRFHDTKSGISGSVTPQQAHSFHSELQDHGIRLIWGNLNLAAAPELRIEAVVQLDSDKPLSRWNMAVRNCGNLRFDEIDFPRVPGIRRQDSEYLAVPVWMGQVAADPRILLNKENKGRELRYEYPGHTSMQCLAFYQQNGPGLLVSCDDTNAFHKTFVFAGDGQQRAGFSVVHLPENDANASRDYVQPYNVVLGSFKGDWFAAADLYRSWATNQWWARESRLMKRGKNWAHDTALWVWNRGRSENVLQPAVALQERLKLPVSAMWHWWHGCAYDIGFPEYLPPREGVESFTNAVAAAHKKHVHAIVYMNQRLWGMTTKSWEEQHATNFAVIGADRTVHPEIYNTFTKSPCASMCMGTSFWRNHYASLTEQAFALGVDGIYMDQACSSLACYNPAHGHPLGGGTYWMDGFRLMATDIRKRAVDLKTRAKYSDGVALAGEGVGESWLPHLDLMLSLQVSKERYSSPDGWDPIPFFQAVYHPFVIQYGNYSSLTMPPYDELWPSEFAPKEPLKLLDQKFSTQFYLEQARAFVWGQQPTIANFRVSQFSERPQEIAFASQLARIRNRSLKFLLHGTFLGSPELDVPQQNIDMSRLSIYAGQRSGLTTFSKEVSPVLSGAWRAPDGTIGVAVANIADETISTPLTLNPSYKVGSAGRIYRIDENGRRKFGTFRDGRVSIDVKLPARTAWLLEFSR